MYVFYYVEVSFLYSHFLENFSHTRVLKYVRSFSASIEMIIRFLFFSLLVWCITFIDLQIVKKSYIPEINLTWSWGMTHLMCSGIQLASIFVEYLCIYVHQCYWPVSFKKKIDMSVWFWYQGEGGLIEWAWECSLFCIFWNNFRRIGVNSSLNIC